MVYDLTFDGIIGNPVVEIPLSMVFFAPIIVSNTLRTKAISNKPRWIIEHVAKKLEEKGR